MNAANDYCDNARKAQSRLIVFCAVCSGIWSLCVKMFVPAVSPSFASAHSPASVSTGSQHVSVSAPPASGADPVAAPPRELTVEEFARLLRRDERTVISYIAAERIAPPPRRDPGTRSWLIASDSVLLPQSAAGSRIEPLPAADSGSREN